MKKSCYGEEVMAVVMVRAALPGSNRMCPSSFTCSLKTFKVGTLLTQNLWPMCICFQNVCQSNFSTLQSRRAFAAPSVLSDPQFIPAWDVLFHPKFGLCGSLFFLICLMKFSNCSWNVPYTPKVLQHADSRIIVWPDFLDYRCLYVTL